MFRKEKLTLSEKTLADIQGSLKFDLITIHAVCMELIENYCCHIGVFIHTLTIQLRIIKNPGKLCCNEIKNSQLCLINFDLTRSRRVTMHLMWLGLRIREQRWNWRPYLSQYASNCCIISKTLDRWWLKCIEWSKISIEFI